MAVNFSESRTKENLMRAFAGESQARNRYTIAAEKAEKAGMYTIADIFRYTADQERAHAERYYELLKDLSGETIHIDGTYPVDHQNSLAELLRAAEHNEHEEYEDVYQAFGDTATEEGFHEAASAGARCQNGCVRTAATFMKAVRHPGSVRPAGMSRDILFLMNSRAIRGSDY